MESLGLFENEVERGLTSLQREEEHEKAVYLALFLCILFIFLGLLTAFAIRRYHIWFLSEAGCLLIIGVIAGTLIRLADNERVVAGIEKLTSFDGDILFIVLLPPIIFDSGYNSSRYDFFNNFGAICALAFLGTFLAAAITGILIYGAGKMEWIYRMNQIESMTFGSLISATDPVTVLNVFQQLGVNEDLYSLVFGESVLNDAVAIVLFKTMVRISHLHEGVSLTIIFQGLGTFLTIFVGSFFVGAFLGCLNAYMLKNIETKTGHLNSFEMATGVLFPYMAYCLAEGLQLSGIVSILFCGFTMAHYSSDNLSPASRLFIQQMFHTFAHIAEGFIFIYLGMASLNSDEVWDEWSFSLYAVFAVLVARVVAIIPVILLVNMCRRRSRRVSLNESFTLWLSGLRGAIAFSLAAKAQYELKREKSGRVMETATMTITFLTVIVIGGIMPWVTVKLGLVSDPESVNQPEIEMTRMDTRENVRGPTILPSASQFFSRLDRVYIRPVLVRGANAFVVDNDPPRIEHANESTPPPETNGETKPEDLFGTTELDLQQESSNETNNRKNSEDKGSLLSLF